MATFSQWLTSYAPNDAVKRLTWLCGSERVLVEEVVDFIRRVVGASDLDYVIMEASSTPPREIWAAANQYPMDPGANRLILVRDAEKIKNWKPLESWLAESRLLPTSYLLLVSNDPELAREPRPQDAPKGAKGELKPHLKMMQDKAHLIECKPFTPDTNTKSPTYGKYVNAINWIQTKAYCTPATAQHLLTRSAGDLGVVTNVCRKAALFSGEMTTQVVDLLVTERASEEFVDALSKMDKRSALRVVEMTETTDYSRIIGSLDSRLDLLGNLYDMLRQRKTTRDISIHYESRAFIVLPLVPYAKHYDNISRQQKRSVLTMLDDSLRSGAREGILESLVGLW